jgi:hypothetical protein
MTDSPLRVSQIRVPPSPSAVPDSSAADRVVHIIGYRTWTGPNDLNAWRNPRSQVRLDKLRLGTRRYASLDNC